MIELCNAARRMKAGKEGNSGEPAKKINRVSGMFSISRGRFCEILTTPISPPSQGGD